MEIEKILIDSEIPGIEKISEFKYNRFWECSYCGAPTFNKHKKPGAVKCTSCQKVETIYKKTIFEGLKTNPDKLFEVLELIFETWEEHYSKKNENEQSKKLLHSRIVRPRITTRMIEKETGVSQKTVNLIFQRIALFAHQAFGKEMEWRPHWSKAFFKQVSTKNKIHYQSLSYLLHTINSITETRDQSYYMFIRMLLENQMSDPTSGAKE